MVGAEKKLINSQRPPKIFLETTTDPEDLMTIIMKPRDQIYENILIIYSNEYI